MEEFCTPEMEKRLESLEREQTSMMKKLTDMRKMAEKMTRQLEAMNEFQARRRSSTTTSSQMRINCPRVSLSAQTVSREEAPRSHRSSSREASNSSRTRTSSHSSKSRTSSSSSSSRPSPTRVRGESSTSSTVEHRCYRCSQSSSHSSSLSSSPHHSQNSSPAISSRPRKTRVREEFPSSSQAVSLSLQVFSPLSFADSVSFSSQLSTLAVPYHAHTSSILIAVDQAVYQAVYENGSQGTLSPMMNTELKLSELKEQEEEVTNADKSKRTGVFVRAETEYLSFPWREKCAAYTQSQDQNLVGEGFELLWDALAMRFVNNKPQTSAIEGSIFTHSEVNPGMIIKGKFNIADSFCIIVQCASGVSARYLELLTEFFPKNKAKDDREIDTYEQSFCISTDVSFSQECCLFKRQLVKLISWSSAEFGLEWTDKFALGSNVEGQVYNIKEFVVVPEVRSLAARVFGSLMRKREEENRPDWGPWQLENLTSHGSIVVHNLCWLLKLYKTNSATTNDSITDTNCLTEWIVNGEICISLVADNELSNLNNIKYASSTLIAPEVRILEGENKETIAASECLEATATNEIEVNLKEQILKLLVQQAVMYWEGRGARKKQKICAISYHPP